MSTDLKPSLTAKQNDCVVYFSSMHTMKMPVKKIQSSFMFYVKTLCVTPVLYEYSYHVSSAYSLSMMEL